MAIARDAQTNGGSFAASPKTWSHTCSGSDRILFVATMCATDTVTGVTYNGVSLTSAGKNNQSASGGYVIQLWYLINPASGSNTVSVTTSSGNVTGISASYTGCLGGIDNTLVETGSAGESSPHNSTITTTANNCWVICVVSAVSAVNGSAGTNFNNFLAFGTPAGSTGFGDSNAAVTPAGSYSMSSVWSDFPFAGRFAYSVMASFSPTAAAGSTRQTLTLMGVGS